MDIVHIQVLVQKTRRVLVIINTVKSFWLEILENLSFLYGSLYRCHDYIVS